jgi:hypothetical protein
MRSISVEGGFATTYMHSGGIPMPGFEGDLLIGRLTLHDLRGELEWEALELESADWLLAGRLELAPEDGPLVQVGRRYRLQLADGRAGQVIIAKIEVDDRHVFVEFQPQNTPNKPR